MYETHTYHASRLLSSSILILQLKSDKNDYKLDEIPVTGHILLLLLHL